MKSRNGKITACTAHHFCAKRNDAAPKKGAKNLC